MAMNPVAGVPVTHAYKKSKKTDDEPKVPTKQSTIGAFFQGWDADIQTSLKAKLDAKDAAKNSEAAAEKPELTPQQQQQATLRFENSLKQKHEFGGGGKKMKLHPVSKSNDNALTPGCANTSTKAHYSTATLRRPSSEYRLSPTPPVAAETTLVEDNEKDWATPWNRLLNKHQRTNLEKVWKLKLFTPQTTIVSETSDSGGGGQASSSTTQPESDDTPPVVMDLTNDDAVPAATPTAAASIIAPPSPVPGGTPPSTVPGGTIRALPPDVVTALTLQRQTNERETGLCLYDLVERVVQTAADADAEPGEGLEVNDLQAPESEICKEVLSKLCDRVEAVVVANVDPAKALAAKKPEDLLLVEVHAFKPAYKNRVIALIKAKGGVNEAFKVLQKQKGATPSKDSLRRWKRHGPFDETDNAKKAASKNMSQAKCKSPAFRDAVGGRVLLLLALGARGSNDLWFNVARQVAVGDRFKNDSAVQNLAVVKVPAAEKSRASGWITGMKKWFNITTQVGDKKKLGKVPTAQ